MNNPAGAYQERLPAEPSWLNTGDNAWQLTAATLVGLQSMPGLVILYYGFSKQRWAMSSAFMALYAFAAVMAVWVLVGFRMSFGNELVPFWGQGIPSLDQNYLTGRAAVPETTHRYANGTVETRKVEPLLPMASLVYFQFTFAAITTILVAGSVLERMTLTAWMAFAPLWVVLCYTVGAYSMWGGGFLYHWGAVDYSGGYVIHLASGISGFTAAFWVGGRLERDRNDHVSCNVVAFLTGAGLIWMGWAGFNGGAPYAANLVSSLAVINTNISAATGLLVWTFLDVYRFKKPSIIGSVHGMITGLACITPGAGLVQPWAATIYGLLAGSVPWYLMMRLHRATWFLSAVDDTMGVLYTHAVAGILGGLLTGVFAHPDLCQMLLPVKRTRGLIYGDGGALLLRQLVAALCFIAWNILATTVVLWFIKIFVKWKMEERDMIEGARAVLTDDGYFSWANVQRPQAVEDNF